MQYEQIFYAIDNILRNEVGCSTELDYIEHTSWLLFLKHFDDLGREREMKAMLSDKFESVGVECNIRLQPPSRYHHQKNMNLK